MLAVLEVAVEFLSADVTVHLQEFFDNEIALLALLELGFREVLFELVPEPSIVLQSFTYNRDPSSSE